MLERRNPPLGDFIETRIPVDEGIVKVVTSHIGQDVYEVSGVSFKVGLTQ